MSITTTVTAGGAHALTLPTSGTYLVEIESTSNSSEPIPIAVTLTCADASSCSPTGEVSPLCEGFAQPAGAQCSFADVATIGTWHDIIPRLVDSHVGTGRFESAWGNSLSELASSSFQTKLRGVNSLVNQFEFIDDPAYEGAVDTTWGTSAENLLANGGDCEDFALVKYLALRELGASPCSLRILEGFHLKAEQNHAVLAVTNEQGRSWVLDNLRADVATLEDYSKDFVVVAGVNESQSWIYGVGCGNDAPLSCGK